MLHFNILTQHLASHGRGRWFEPSIAHHFPFADQRDTEATLAFAGIKADASAHPPAFIMICAEKPTPA